MSSTNNSSNSTSSDTDDQVTERTANGDDGDDAEWWTRTALSDDTVNTVIEESAVEQLSQLPADSAHAVVTDPPYGLAFMGMSWDDFNPKEYQEWCEEWAREARRVLKPGGHLIAFSGNRTHHRLFCGVEDAGFTIRDTVTWHYSTGFPKALDVSKAIDKQLDAAEDREVVATRRVNDMRGGEYGAAATSSDGSTERDTEYEDTEAATQAAAAWDGFKSALKPATEFAVLARAPLSESSIARNVREHGTGALNIDACRVPIPTGDDVNFSENWGFTAAKGWNENTMQDADPNNGECEAHADGRYPSNVVFGEVVAERLDRETRDRDSSGARPADTSAASGALYGDYDDYDRDNPDGRVELDDGQGASRYFYTSKAAKSERTVDGLLDHEDAHPTVKPLDLMKWLVTLVTREGQVVVDPFCGSGTTLKAAKNAGRRFVGIDQDAKWCDVARARVGLDLEDPTRFTDDEQRALADYTHRNPDDTE